MLLPPGELTMTYGRGPEYRLLAARRSPFPRKATLKSTVKLERWINPMDYGFYSGDHHIHAAGCAHYTSPTEGVIPEDMFLHVKGEGLNVGCNLTWGPCYDYQRQFFEPTPHKLSEPFTVLKYDIEVSGFGSQALGHVCLLNLRDQTYPGSDGTKTKGWPTWTTPLMHGPRQQGGVTGYAHSANGLNINPAAAAKRLLAELDTNKDGVLSAEEAAKGLLPEDFATIDANNDKVLSRGRAGSRASRAWPDRLPNLAIPEMDGIGAQEICVTVGPGAVRFHQRHGHRARAGVELLVSPHELRLPAQGQRRDRFPLHHRQPGRPGPGLRAARQGRPHRFRRLVRGHRQGPILRLRRLRPRPGVHRGRQGARSATSRSRSRAR